MCVDNMILIIDIYSNNVVLTTGINGSEKIIGYNTKEELILALQKAIIYCYENKEKQNAIWKNGKIEGWYEKNKKG